MLTLAFLHAEASGLTVRQLQSRLRHHRIAFKSTDRRAVLVAIYNDHRPLVLMDPLDGRRKRSPGDGDTASVNRPKRARTSNPSNQAESHPDSQGGAENRWPRKSFVPLTCLIL